MTKKKDAATPIRAKLNVVGKRLEKQGAFRSENEIKEWERLKSSRQMIHSVVTDTKKYIGKHIQAGEQLLFSFMPTQMTRTSPFFPMSKRQMKDRPIERGLTWDTPWGRITVSGERLSVYDETVLLSLLVLVRRYNSEAIETSLYELCKISNVKPASNTYNALWKSITRLSKTDIEITKIVGKGQRRKETEDLGGNIITFRHRNRKTGKLRLIMNVYFLEMYAEGFLTNLDLKFRAALKGDTSKALYRFFQGQQPFYKTGKYEIQLLKLCRAINLKTDAVELRRLRTQIRTGLKELRKQGYIDRWQLNKKDNVIVWSNPKTLLNN
jgi:hypothetical protein